MGRPSVPMLTKVYIMVYTSDGKDGDDYDSGEGF